MAKQSGSSSSKKHTPQSISFGTSPDEVLDTVDTGDETQLRFRYQHAYGVILLLAALSGEKPYTVLWCEHHEDLLGQRNDGFFDAYQIKTRRDGLWNMSDDPFKDSIKRFVEVDQRFPGKIKEFFFVSNAPYENSNAQNKARRSPERFLQAVKHASSPSDLPSPFNTTFEELRLHCHCEPLSLMTMLKKLDFLPGPGLDSFEAEIAHRQLSKILECRALAATALAQLLDELIAKVYKASCLSVSDPARHWCGLNKSDRDNPKLQAKRIVTESVLSFIQENQPRLLNVTKDAPVLSGRLKETLDLYLIQSFEDDRVAKLDQAGETDPERTTLLHQVFVDLELKPRSDQPRPPRHLEQSQLALFVEPEQLPEIAPSNREKPLSAMDCFLKEVSSKNVVIGGPGQGKSTLGQYLAQVHRSILLKREKELYRDTAGGLEPQRKFQPKTVRLPFRIVLKYFAQWLADVPALNTVEAYIAEQIGKGASRPGEVDAASVQEILKAHPILLILDGLDEVTEQALCNRMLTCVEQFLARAEQLGTDMQVIATSRPTSYRNQFTPRLFWHLELQPMSVEKVREYAACWTHLKEPIVEERRRIKETLEECLKESHTHPLLTTPLQVTIILLIIKDGGRPASQREELFQQYWTTILHREKSKAKGMIRTEDTVLFGLHAYLGYLLHRNAAGKNIRSLFPVDEFKQIVCDFLRSKDDISPPAVIQQRATYMVEEARTRLVLLVEPEPGFFGFELRSLQEFFAGAYLAQTACDTQQRFDRLKAIAYSEHWRNVALFCAGRIVRDFSGEAVYILEAVCRPMDRDLPDTYLHRGAWLALDIAADGIFTTNNRNLQYSTLELALTVLHTGMTDQGKSHLEAALQRLSSEDRRDILSKLLRQKLASLPPSCLPPALKRFGSLTGGQQDFIQALEVLLSTNKQEYVLEALNIGFQYKVNPEWLALQLEKYWNLWINKQAYPYLGELWYQNRQHTQKVLSALSLSEDQVSSLMDHLLSLLYRIPPREVDLKLMENPRTYSEQIAVLLQCLHIINNYPPSPLASIELQLGKSLKVHRADTGRFINRIAKAFTNSGLSATLDQLMGRSDLMPQLRVCLWILYWQTHEPTEPMVTTFLAESKAWSEEQPLSKFLQMWHSHFWPLLALALESQMNNDQHTLALLRPYLNISNEISFSQQVGAALQKGLDKLSREEQLATVLCHYYTAHHFPELASIAEKLGVDSNRLIDKYTALSIFANLKLSSAVLQGIFSNIEKSIAQSQKPQMLWWVLLNHKWELDHEATQQGVQLLHVLVARLPQQPTTLQIAVILFLKLLPFDTTPLLLAPAILSYLADETRLRDTPTWYLADTLSDIPEEHLTRLANFTTHEDAKVQQGALTLWTNLIEIVSDRPYFTTRQTPKLKVLSFDWRLGLYLIKDTDIAQRKKGIKLLTYSHFPISETQYLAVLRNAMAQAQDEEEIAAWMLFLRNVPVGRPEKKAWQKLLQTLLDAPQSNSYGILTAAMERYTELEGVAGPEIKNERALDLPVLVPSKRGRAGR